MEQSYTNRKPKDIERKILALHKSGNVNNKKIRGMSEAESKMAYIKLAQSLQTFGTTFFLVKVDQTLKTCYNNIFDNFSGSYQFQKIFLFILSSIRNKFLERIN